MKNSQHGTGSVHYAASSGQPSSSQQPRQSTNTDFQQTHHGNSTNANYRRASTDVASSHQQRSKSSSHNTHGSNREQSVAGYTGPSGHTEGARGSSVQQSTRNAPQPRSNSYAKQQSQSKAQRDQQNGQSNNASSSTNAVGHYILGKALGEGTFGKVKLGTHVLTGEKVAVKVLEKSKIKDRKDVERISREIKILKQLHHPNVVQIYEIIETDKDLYLVMEYASGGELFELIVQNQKLKERTASKHLQELLAGVHYIHKLGICHRDLKPENLLIDFDGQLKIVDFGLSNMYGSGQTLKTACGSPCYAAPEMIAGHRYHGLKSDIWSCGVVLYAMLCGFLPFEDQKTSNLYKKIMNAEYTLPKFLSDDAKDILAKIFVTDPNKRIDVEGLKQHPWYKLHQPENANFSFHTKARAVNDKLVQKMEASLGFSTESVQRAVENNKHNHLSATYYLLLKKYAQASFKQQAQQRTASIPARVNSHNVEHQQRRKPATHTQASDSKQRGSVAQEESDSKLNSSSATASNKHGKFRPKHEADRLKAPVQDQLVLKNHRREQSANATAGRHNKNGGWGDVHDERRTESYERPAENDDYEIVISKVNRGQTGDDKHGSQREPKGAQAPNPSQINRSHFISPSPEITPAQGRQRQGTSQVAKSTAVPPSSQGVSSKQQKQAMEVNISNMKQQTFNSVTTPQESSSHQRTSSMAARSQFTKAATYTQATISSSQRSAEKQKQLKQQKERQASAHGTTHSTSTTQTQQPNLHHRKTKSNMPDMQKQTTIKTGGDQSRPLVDSSVLDKQKFSQTQKISNLAKSTVSSTKHSNHHHHHNSSIASNNGRSTKEGAHAQSTAVGNSVSEMMVSLNQQKTYFDQITAKHKGDSHAQAKASTSSAAYQSRKQDKSGIEGCTISQSGTIVNVNENPKSSGIFQKYSTQGLQRPILQDANSQNLLKRLESGNSENQLRQNYVKQQARLSNENHAQLLAAQGNRCSPRSRREPEPYNKKSTLQVDDPRNAQSRLSQASQSNQLYVSQQSSKTPVTGYQTLDTMGEVSSHEIRIPISHEADRGVTKALFYGTQKVNVKQASLNHEVQKYNDESIDETSKKDFAQTQSLSNSVHLAHKEHLFQKDLVHGGHDSGSRQHNIAQPKTSLSTKHQRNSSTIVQARTVATDHNPSSNSNSKTNFSHVTRSNGFNIPTQHMQGTHHVTAQPKAASQQKFNSIKTTSGGSSVKHATSTIDQRQSYQSKTPAHFNQSTHSTVHHNSSTTSHTKRTIEPKSSKVRSQSVSGQQPKGSNVYTPSSHKKASAITTGTSGTTLTVSQAHGGPTTLTAHYRCSTASSTNKERRSSQPPQSTTHAHGPSHLSQPGSSLVTSTTHASKQRSASSTNYQSAMMAKNLDQRSGKETAHTSVTNTQRGRQKSSHRDTANSSMIQYLQQEKQFQSITHNVNSSTLQQQLEDTIFNQSYSGNTNSSVASRYKVANSSNYSKRKQQVTSINQLLSAVDSLNQSSSYAQRQRTGLNASSYVSTAKDSASDIRGVVKQNNFFQSQQSSSSGHRPNATATGTSLNDQLNNSIQGKPIMVPDVGISMSQIYSNSQQPGSTDLKSSLVVDQQTPGSVNKSTSITSQQQQSQSKQGHHKLALSSTVMQDSFAERNSATSNAINNMLSFTTQGGNYAQVPQGSSYHPVSYQQSYLSDLFSKQGSSGTKNYHQSTTQGLQTTTNHQSGSKPVSTGLHNQGLFLNQQMSQANQTQPLSLKSSLYSPGTRAKSTSIQQPSLIVDASSQQTQQPDNHQIPQTNYSGLLANFTSANRASSIYGGNGTQKGSTDQHFLLQQQQQQQQQQFQSMPPTTQNLMSHFLPSQQQQQPGLAKNDQLHTAISLLQQSQQQTQGQAPHLYQKMALMQGSSHAQTYFGSSLAPQKSNQPSVPAPSTNYQHLLTQQSGQPGADGLNFYPVQPSLSHSQYT